MTKECALKASCGGLRWEEISIWMRSDRLVKTNGSNVKDDKKRERLIRWQSKTRPEQCVRIKPFGEKAFHQQKFLVPKKGTKLVRPNDQKTLGLSLSYLFKNLHSTWMVQLEWFKFKQINDQPNRENFWIWLKGFYLFRDSICILLWLVRLSQGANPNSSSFSAVFEVTSIRFSNNKRLTIFNTLLKSGLFEGRI